MEPEDTGCHGGWDGKGSLEGLLGPPLDTLCPQSWVPSLLFSRFLSKMVALLSSEPTCRLLAYACQGTSKCTARVGLATQVGRSLRRQQAHGALGWALPQTFVWPGRVSHFCVSASALGGQDLSPKTH